MKYIAIIAGAVLLGLHWASDMGWLVVLTVAWFIINEVIDYEQRKTGRPS